ncbi:NUDIX domain-containing protein [Pseudomonas fortuita]|uniref:NUDIX domain-containing protein n=1 Tax=Pseudomonas fortuita TaxID=3233375 RepID=UPI0035C9054F
MRDKRKCRIKSRATIICLRSGRVLLVRKKGGKWNFPGGLIEPGESPHAAAARELREETSIEGHGLLSLCSIRVGSGSCPRKWCNSSWLWPLSLPFS